MTQPHSITALIDLWPTRRQLADDVGVMTDRVHKWAKSNAIPARFHLRVVRAGAERGFPVSADLLVVLHDDGLVPPETGCHEIAPSAVPENAGGV